MPCKPLNMVEHEEKPKMSSWMAKIRCAHQKYGDFNIEIDLAWTVRDFKMHLSQAYPSKPDPNLQRLVFAGQLMKDSEKVINYLNRLPDIELPIIHLVYTPNISDQPLKKSPVLAESELRRRKLTVPQTPAPPSGQNLSTSAVTNSETPAGLAGQQFFAGTNFAQPGFNMQAQPFSMNHPYVNQYFQYLQQLYGPVYWPYGNFAGNTAGGNFSGFIVPQMFPGGMNAAVTDTGLMNFPQFGTVDNVPAAGLQAQAVGGSQAVPQPQAAVPQNLPQQAVPQPPQRDLAMNAQGGVAEDDDEGRNRDWLDYVYTAARAGLLFVILYSYSSMERLSFVLVCCVLLYGFHAGWFARRRPAPAPANPVRAQAAAADQSEQAPPRTPTNQGASNGESRDDAVAVAPPVEGGVENSSNPNASGELVSTNQIRATSDNSQSAWHVFWSTCYIFISSFFASLIPERPPPVNLN